LEPMSMQAARAKVTELLMLAQRAETRLVCRKRRAARSASLLE
jgi:hypothetical protein